MDHIATVTSNTPKKQLLLVDEESSYKQVYKKTKAALDKAIIKCLFHDHAILPLLNSERITMQTPALTLRTLSEEPLPPNSNKPLLLSPQLSVSSSMIASFRMPGCDASTIIASTPGNKAEKDHPDNLSLAGDGFDAVIKAKAAVDAVPRCKNKVSCADILALATRDVIALSGGPTYPVELGRLDGLKSTAESVNGNLPHPNFNLDQLNKMFTSRGLSQADMIALSACHTVGFSHCEKFSNRIYNFSRQNPVDPTLNRQYATDLQRMCPRDVDPRIAIDMDPTTPRQFDNAYFKNLVQGKGLFTSDQVLFTDRRSRNTVNTWASNPKAFNDALIEAMTKLGGSSQDREEWEYSIRLWKI
ncbi:hypothetical protein DH2020_016103 [Rehmannia glutinosa]|uniref:Peroxidase n=1 Tax=Rehmannia glutinosa TaxID=99300 RepID=A0ABR0WX48_REHGL